MGSPEVQEHTLGLTPSGRPPSRELTSPKVQEPPLQQNVYYTYQNPMMSHGIWRPWLVMVPLNQTLGNFGAPPFWFEHLWKH